ncbi:MAG: helix-turn-helix domain-containing protein [Treponema sp.]|nr:helix-turn-helix domain-containing protein [Treponema sp.]
MNILVLTKNLESYNFDAYLRNNGYKPIVCPSLNLVLDFQREEKIGMLICDFRYFSCESRNPYETLNEKLGGRKIPFIFYNDPFPEFTTEGFVEQWKRTLMHYYGEVTVWAEEFLECMSVAVICASVHDSCSPGLCNGQKVDSGGKFFMDSLEKLREMFNMPPSKFRLFETFFKNPGEEMDAEELCLRMWGKSDEHSMANLYSYVAFIRKIMQGFPNLSMSIDRTGKGRYVFRMDIDALRKEFV